MTDQINRETMFKLIRKWYLKHFEFDTWWKEFCEEHYCSNCKAKEDGCFIDYVSGKCCK